MRRSARGRDRRVCRREDGPGGQEGQRHHRKDLLERNRVPEAIYDEGTGVRVCKAEVDDIPSLRLPSGLRTSLRRLVVRRIPDLKERTFNRQGPFDLHRFVLHYQHPGRRH